MYPVSGTAVIEISSPALKAFFSGNIVIVPPSVGTTNVLIVNDWLVSVPHWTNKIAKIDMKMSLFTINAFD